jgi:hypothetical protein
MVVSVAGRFGYIMQAHLKLQSYLQIIDYSDCITNKENKGMSLHYCTLTSSLWLMASAECSRALITEA